MLVHVVWLVEEISQRGCVNFSYCMGPPNSSAGAWDERLTLNDHGWVKISMDPASNLEWEAARDLKRVELYVAQCVQLSGILRHMKHQRKQAQQAGRGQAKEGIPMDMKE